MVRPPAERLSSELVIDQANGWQGQPISASRSSSRVLDPANKTIGRRDLTSGALDFSMADKLLSDQTSGGGVDHCLPCNRSNILLFFVAGILQRSLHLTGKYTAPATT